MPGCSTGRNIQKYKGAAASTLQDVTDNGNTTTGDLITTIGNIYVSNGYYVGDGSLLTGIAGASSAFSFQDTSDRGNTTSNTIQFINTHTSLITSGNIVVAGNVTATDFYGDGTTLTGITLSTDMTSNVIRISNLETNLTANSVRIGSLETDLTSNATRVTNLETDLTSNASRIGSLETDLTSNASRIGSAETNISSLETDVTSNASRITSLETDLSSNASRIGTAETNISSLETDVTSNTARVGSLETDLTSNASRITTVENNVLISNSSGITSGIGQGEILIGHLTNQLSTLALGADSQVLTCNTTSGRPEWKSASAIGTTVATLSNTAYIIGGAYNGGSAKTWSLKASTANSTDHIVIRDNSGNVYATEYHGDYIKHAGDIDTHLGFPSNDTFTVTTDGTERMKIDSSGTTIPEYIIHNGDTNTKFGFPSDDTFTVTTDTHERLRIDSSGRVGISNTNPQDELSVGGDINLTGKIKINGSTGNATQVLTSGGSGGAMTWADAGAATNYWVRSGSSPNYIVTTPTPQSKVGISNTYAVNHTLHIGSNVIVSDTGGHDVLRVNGNVFCTNYLFGDGSKIRNLNTIRTETGANQISVGSDDGGPVLSWRERQIRYQYGTTGRPVPSGYGF